MDITYRPGVSHGNADGVSRREYKTENSDKSETEELLNVLPKYVIEDTAKVSAVKRNSSIPKRVITDEKQKGVSQIAESTQTIWYMNDFKNNQRDDAHFKYIVAFLESGKLPTDVAVKRKVLLLQPQYFLSDGILYHVEEKGKRNNRHRVTHIQVAVPRKFVTESIEGNTQFCTRRASRNKPNITENKTFVFLAVNNNRRYELGESV